MNLIKLIERSILELRREGATREDIKGGGESASLKGIAFTESKFAENSIGQSHPYFGLTY